MSQLVVVTFDNPGEAGKLRHTLRSAERAAQLRLDDSAVIVKDEEGKTPATTRSTDWRAGQSASLLGRQL